MLIEYPDIQQGTEAWHDVRRGLVTASSVGKLLTPTLKVADNDTSRALTATLVAERLTGWTEESYTFAAMQNGHEYEPFARDAYSGYYQQAVECGFMLREEDGWSLGCSPDGLVGDQGLIEIKVRVAKFQLHTILNGEMPRQFMAQCQAALLVSGRDWIDFVSYCGGMPMFVKRVLPDADWFAALEAACRTFEQNAAAIVADYRSRVANLPTTERIDFNLVELKLA
jgi:hypothetical protein